MRLLIFIGLFFLHSLGSAAQGESTFSFEEYIGMVKKHHPIVKQANLILTESELKLLKSRGAFDPKFELNLNEKQFKDQEYYSRTNGSFKIPTWYGVEFKADYENNSGVFLNPESSVPEAGLFSAGVSVSVGEGLWINKRLTALKQAKLYVNQAELDNQLLVNDILFKASVTYFSWLQAFKELQVYDEFLENAQERFEGIIIGVELGENPPIDSTEAKIILNNRNLNLEKAKLNYLKSSLELSNYLWIDNVPLELSENLEPEEKLMAEIDVLLNISGFNSELYQVSSHPKIRSFGYKIQGADLDRRLKRNLILPTVDLSYNALNENFSGENYFSGNDYKFGVFIEMPLFLRKERADLKLAKLKIDALNFELSATELALKNKISSATQEVSSYQNQLVLTEEIISDYTILLNGEETKFQAGESSLFLINSRESKLIENKLKAIKTENQLLMAKGKLFNVLGVY